MSLTSRPKVYAFAGALFFTLVLGLIMVQERLIFFPEKLDADYKFSFNNATEEDFEFEGLKISSLLFPEESSKQVILFFHGNAGSLKGWGEVGEELRAKLKVNIWVLDYPGYGKSEGIIQSERQLLALAERFYELAKLRFPKSQLIAYGRSIGSAPAAWMAVQKKIPLILESPFSSFSKLASEIAPWFPPFLRRYSFKNETWLENYKLPLLLIHGAGDEVIPVNHSRDLSKKITHARYVEVGGAAHNNLSSYEDYWLALKETLKSLAET